MADTEQQVIESLREKEGRLHHRENQELEFKEQFNFAGLAEYFRDFAAFANNRGGYLIFGVTDSPRKATGLSVSAANQFDKVDPEKITGYILNLFSTEIIWRHDVISHKGKKFGYFRVFEHHAKPVIAKKDEGKDQEIRNGDIYYRYGGRTQRIQSSELENIINGRIEQTNRSWIDLMSKIGSIGPQNAAILDTEAGVVEKGKNQVLVIDDALLKKISFIKEGEFSETEGAKTLKLIGDVVPVDRVEVIKLEKEHLTKQYPLSAAELAEEVKKKCPSAKQNGVWIAIRENDMKNNKDYSAYNFRNKKQEDAFHDTGTVPSNTPSIYNHKAIDFICRILENEDTQQVAS
jgi:hypothetical protein